MKRSLQRGLTMIELVIGVVVVGMLSAVALPLYREHGVRAKVEQLVGLAHACRASIAQARPAGRDLPACQSLAATTATQYLAWLQVAENGAITVASLGLSDLREAAWTTIALTPYKSATEPLGPRDGWASIHHWRCGPGQHHPMPRKYLPPSCQG